MNTESNAMTEVALAMAMAFFAIFVLTAVSMGLPSSEAAEKSNQQIATIEFSTSVGEARTISEEETLIVYSKGSYYNRFLDRVDHHRFIDQKYVLAVSPMVTVTEIIEAKRPMGNAAVSIALLNEAWLARLDEL